jgi:energy-coupling factor transporter ATP-binding protein EcfA2
MILNNIRLKHFSETLGPRELRLIPSHAILLLGPSGCGKSSLMKCMAGYSEPADGNISFEGKTAILLQNPHYQIIMQTVREELNFPLKNAGKMEKERDEAINEIISLLDIRSLLHRDVNTLSFGEVQLVMLAATFLTEADIYLLDEPTSHLDPPAVRACYRCMDLLKQRGKTICSSGQISDEYSYFDEVWIMEKGSIKACVPAGEFGKKMDTYGMHSDRQLIRERLIALGGQ